jgi:hypothetical protein
VYIRDVIRNPNPIPTIMSYYRTETGGTSSVQSYNFSTSTIGTHNQGYFNNKLPIKYQEVHRLVSQLSGNRKDWADDKFILTGIRNILMGA